MCNCNQRTQYFTLVMRMIFSWDIWMVFNWDKFKDVLKAARWMQATKWDLAVLMRWLMLLVDVGSLTAFEPKGDLNGISQWWKRWKRSFASYLTGKGDTDDKQKRALLLHAAGVDVQIYFTMVSEEEIFSFTTTMKALDDYIVPKSTVPFESHFF